MANVFAGIIERAGVDLDIIVNLHMTQIFINLMQQKITCQNK
jgi:hypothetical protein